MKKIKFLVQVKDGKKGITINKDEEVDLGLERNEKAVKNNLAVWVDSTEYTQAKKEIEKKEETPKKTISSPKGKKIETK